MKTKTSTKIRKTLSKILFGVAAILAISCAPRASAVPVTFSGGSGEQLSFTLLQPVTYAVTAPAIAGTGPAFVFENVGDLFLGQGMGFTGSITYTINSGPSRPISFINSGLNGGTLDDVFFLELPPPGVSAGDTIVLSAGMLTTTLPVLAAAPANGTFNTFLIDAEGNRISLDGTVPVGVPDSLSTLWLGLPLAGMLALARLRQRRLG